jgi:predicted transcriptional regulator of viral defense system
MADWNLLTSHGLVLVCIAKNPNMTAREIGDAVSLTERTAHKVIVALEEEGYIERVKTGRQNAYRIHPDAPIKDVVTDASIGELLWPLAGKRRSRQAKGEVLAHREA